MSLLSSIATYWVDGALRSLQAFGRGYGSPETDPPPVTPYQVVYEGGKVSLRHYKPDKRVHKTPILLVYALIKRPYILDLQEGKSVVQSLLGQGFEVYLIDWLPPSREDAWRGFDAYVNEDLANAVHAVQIAEGVERVNLMGYCFGALLALLYAALHPGNVKNLVTLTIPFDMGIRELSFYKLLDSMTDATVDLITKVYGNCPAWLVNGGFTAMAPVHHALDKYVGLYRNSEREGFGEMFELFESWMSSDVPLAGRIFNELVTGIFKRNELVKGEFVVGDRTVDLGNVTFPLLNVVAENDDVVHPKSSLPLPDYVAAEDKRNITFPTGHLGAVVSAGAIAKLWPQVGAWMGERDA